MPPPSSSPLLLLLLFLLLCPDMWSYEAPEDKQDVFARRACAAFLTFFNAAYLAGVTLELPCHCKPQQVFSDIEQSINVLYSELVAAGRDSSTAAPGYLRSYQAAHHRLLLATKYNLIMQLNRVQSVVWFFRKHTGGSKETRALTDHHGNKLLDPSHVPHSGALQSRFSIRLFSLLIFRAGPDDSGIYICGSAHKDFFYGYDLDIQEARTLSFTPRLTPESISNKRKERKRVGSAQPLYRVFTSFRPWSVCDRCGVPGEQVRVGLCYVHSHFLHVRYRRANQTVASCGSGAVPKAFGQLKRSRVGAKLEVKSCQVTCPTQAPPSSKILALMAFLGYNSASLPVEVPVFYLNHPADRILTLGCPGARPNMAVAWDRGSEPIYRSEHSAGHNLNAPPPRLLIDTGHHLVFKPAKTQDSGVYYCWLQGHQAAKIRLLVYAHLGRGQSVTSHPDFPTALKTVLRSYAVMTAVFCLLVFGRAGVRHLRDTRETHVD